MNTREILNERQTTHGDFTDNATYSQNLKRYIQDTKGWQELTIAQKEALEMIAIKIARILSGDPHTKQHWEDIAGYSELIVMRCHDYEG